MDDSRDIGDGATAAEVATLAEETGNSEVATGTIVSELAGRAEVTTGGGVETGAATGVSGAAAMGVASSVITTPGFGA